MAYEVKKGVPPPTTKRGRASVYPLKTMPPDTYFDAPAAEATQVRYSIVYVQRTSKLKFMTRVYVHEGIIRVWRIR